MPLDASIPLQVKAPEIASPLQTVGGLMQMRDMASQIALRQQQTADIQAQAQQRQRDLRSWNDLQDKIRDPEVQKRMASGDYSDVYNTATPDVANKFIKEHQGIVETAQKLRVGEAEYHDKNRGLLANLIEGVDPKDDNKAAEQFNNGLDNLSSEAPDLAQQLHHLTPGPNFRQQLKDIASTNAIAKTVLEHQMEIEAKAATTKEVTAKGALEEAEAPGAKAKSDIEVAQAAALKNLTPQNIEQTVDSLIDPKKYPDENQRAKVMANQALTMGMGLPAIQAALKDSADRVGRTEAAVAQAKATMPIKIETGQALAEAKTTPMLIPDGKGGYTLKNFKESESIPQGAVTAAGASSMEVPTSQTRTMAEKAPRVMNLVDRVTQILDENEHQLGPLQSRWNEFTAGKIGLPNKGYTQLRTDVGLLTTALMNMHVGARGGQQIIQHFQDLLDSARQDPVNLRAALGEVRDYAQTVQKEGTGTREQQTPQNVIEQFSPSTKQYRYSTDGGKTWQTGRAPGKTPGKTPNQE